MTTEKWSQYLFDTFARLSFVPVAFITAKDEVNIKKLINLSQTIAKQAQIRVPTSRINEVLRAAILNNHPPLRSGRQARIYFGTQVAVAPPTIVLKCNDAELIDRSWQRYLQGVFHETLPFPEVPLKVHYRSRGSGEEHRGSPGAPQCDPRGGRHL